MSYVKLGKIVNTHGIHGEIKVLPYTNVENMFSSLTELKCGDEILSVQSVKHIKNCAVLKIENCSDIETAEKYIGSEVFADETAFPQLDSNSYYVKDIIGLSAVDVNCGEVGKITDVIFTGANDVYEITANSGKTALVPAVKQFVKNVDLNSKTVTLELIDGMFPQ